MISKRRSISLLAAAAASSFLPSADAFAVIPSKSCATTRYAGSLYVTDNRSSDQELWNESDGTACTSGRRSFFADAIAPSILAVAAVAVSSSPAANALDMDAFANSQLAADAAPSKKDMSDDEALCKFGAPGKDRGEACQRAGLKTSKGNKQGVDAFGNVDRGDFVRCEREWKVVNGKYEKFDTCK